MRVSLSRRAATQLRWSQPAEPHLHHIGPRKVEETVPVELRDALLKLVRLAAALSDCIQRYDEKIEKLGREKYGHTAQLQQVKGVGADGSDSQCRTLSLLTGARVAANFLAEFFPPLTKILFCSRASNINRRDVYLLLPKDPRRYWKARKEGLL